MTIVSGGRSLEKCVELEKVERNRLKGMYPHENGYYIVGISGHCAPDPREKAFIDANNPRRVKVH